MSWTRKSLIILVVIILSGIYALPHFLQAQQAGNGYNYLDKKFGVHFSFTPKKDEVMIRFTPGTKGPSAKALTQSWQLKTIHDAVDMHRFGVYKLTGEQKPSSLIKSLKASPDIKAVAPVMVDHEGYTRYFMPDEFTVQFHKRLSKSQMEQIIHTFGCSIVKEQWTYGYYTLSVPEGKNPFEMVHIFMDLAEVDFSELSFIGFNDFCFDPGDTHYPQQWALYNTGTTGGTADADIDAREAWDIERGSADVLIAVIDSGVDWDHPDLGRNIAQNLGEDADLDGSTLELSGGHWIMDPGDLNGIDDDGNGQVDDLIGWDFDNNNNNPWPEAGPSSRPHGTSCAGIAAAVTDNAAEGVAGIAHQCRIMPLQINLYSGMNQNRADAINYAATFTSQYSGVVLSCSWRASGNITAIHNAMDDAKDAGVVICFASANDDTTPISYPARYTSCIAVGATSMCDERKSSTSCDGDWWWGSNWGPELDIAAPGVHLHTTDMVGANGYSLGDYTDSFGGTSGATPHVAGAAALLLSYDSTLSPDQVQDLLQRGADKVGGYDYNHDPVNPGHSLELGYGRLNVNRALQHLIAESVVAMLPTPTDLVICIDRSASMVPEKLIALKNAAEQVVRLMNIGDDLGITMYNHNPSHVFPSTPTMINITTETDKDNAITAIEGITATGLTSIGGGLQLSQEKISTATTPHYPQAIILMSDGVNTASPDPYAVLPSIPSETDVYTIGFGTIGGNVDEITLQDIAALTGGTYFFAGADGISSSSDAQDSKQVVGSSGGVQLIKAYQASLNFAAGREIVSLFSGYSPKTPFEYDIPVDKSTSEVRFSLLAERLYVAPPISYFELKDPSGNVIDPDDAENNPLIDYIKDLTVASYTVRQPEPGTWKLIGLALTEYHISVSVYSNLKSHLQVKNWGTSVPTVIQLRITQDGHPVPNSTVRATIGCPNNEDVSLDLYDDGKHRDGDAQDGIYANTFTQYQYPYYGSYTIETNATGKTLEGIPFKRYNVKTCYVRNDPDLANPKVSLPDLMAPRGEVKIPIQVNSDVTGREIVTFFKAFTFDPAILTPKGSSDTHGTLCENWNIQVNIVGDRIEIAGDGQEFLQGQGILVYIPVNIIGNEGATSKLEFLKADFFNSANEKIETHTTNGSLKVGSSVFIDSGDPVPDIVANGMDDVVYLKKDDQLKVTISLSPNTHVNEKADWWILAYCSPSPYVGLYWYTLNNGWVPSLTPIRVYGGPLRELSSYSILNTNSLPEGNWRFFFCVDDNMDNRCDATYLDSVKVVKE